MAKVYSKNNNLKKKCFHARLGMFAWFGITGLSFLVWTANTMVFHFNNPYFQFLCYILLAFSGFMGKVMKGKVEKLEAGLQGNEITVEFLRKLPNTYSIVSGCHITFEGKSSEVDNIIVGPNGVFVVETKNHNGSITGNYMEKNFSQTKIGRGGTPYTNQMYNPIKQVSTHVYRLSNYLKSQGVNVWVQGAVYFSNEQAKVNVEYDYNKVPVFAKSLNGDNELCYYISEYKCRKELSQADVDNIMSLIVEK